VAITPRYTAHFKTGAAYSDTAHTEEDVKKILAAAREVVKDMQAP